MQPRAVNVAYQVERDRDVPADAPTIVLAHSLGSTRAMWEAQVPALRRVARVVRFDARGHGTSPVPDGPYSIDDLVDDLLALLDTLDVARAHLVGLSLGGMTAMRLAARHPERVDRMVLLCTSARLEPVQVWKDRAATVRARGPGAIAEAIVARWYTEEFRATQPDWVAAAAEMVASTPAEGYASCCDAVAEMDLRPDLPRISAPVLAIAGAEDPATPPPHLELIATSVQNGRLLTVPSAAHLANDERPDVVTPAILEHLGLA